MINYKRTKLGKLPGELPIKTKILMLESNQISSIHVIDMKCMKKYRKEHYKRANRRFRHNENNIESL